MRTFSLHIDERGVFTGLLLPINLLILFLYSIIIRRFYVIAKRNDQPSYNHIYSFNSLLRMVKLPVTVQLVIGPRPRNSPFFSDSDPFWPCSGSYDSKILLGTNFSAVMRLEEVEVSSNFLIEFTSLVATAFRRCET